MNTQTFYDLGLRGYYEYGSNIVYTYTKNSYEYRESDYLEVGLTYKKGSDVIYTQLYFLQGSNDPISIILTKNGSPINNHSDYIKTSRITVEKLTNAVRLNPVLVFRHKPDFIDKDYKLMNLHFVLRRGVQTNPVTTLSYVVTAMSDLMLVDTYRTLKVNDASKYLSHVTFTAEGIDYDTMRSRQVRINFEDKYVNVESPLVRHVTPPVTFTGSYTIPVNLNATGSHSSFEVDIRVTNQASNAYGYAVVFSKPNNVKRSLDSHLEVTINSVTLNPRVNTFSITVKGVYYTRDGNYVSGIDGNATLSSIALSQTQIATVGIPESSRTYLPHSDVTKPSHLPIGSLYRINYDYYGILLGFNGDKFSKYFNQTINVPVTLKDSTMNPYPNVTIGLDNMAVMPFKVRLTSPNLVNGVYSMYKIDFFMSNNGVAVFYPNSASGSGSTVTVDGDLKVHKNSLPDLNTGRFLGMNFRTPKYTVSQKLSSIRYDGTLLTNTSNRKPKVTSDDTYSYLRGLQFNPDIVNSKGVLDHVVTLDVTYERDGVQSTLTGRFDIKDYSNPLIIRPLNTEGNRNFRALREDGVYDPIHADSIFSHANQYRVEHHMKERGNLSGNYATAYDQYFPHLYKRIVFNGVEINKNLEPGDIVAFVEEDYAHLIPHPNDYNMLDSRRMYVHIYKSPVYIGNTYGTKQLHYQIDAPKFNFGFKFRRKSDGSEFNFTSTENHTYEQLFNLNGRPNFHTQWTYGNAVRDVTSHQAINTVTSPQRYILFSWQSRFHKIGFRISDFDVGYAEERRFYGVATRNDVQFSVSINDSTGNGFAIRSLDQGIHYISFQKQDLESEIDAYRMGSAILVSVREDESVLSHVDSQGIKSYVTLVLDVTIRTPHGRGRMDIIDYTKSYNYVGHFIDNIVEIMPTPDRGTYEVDLDIQMNYTESQYRRSVRVLDYGTRKHINEAS